MLRLHKISIVFFSLLYALGTTHTFAQGTAEKDRVMFVLDGSNSMWGQIEGVAKISIAKDVMVDLITDWDDNVDMGLMIYGHRRKDDCRDIEVVTMPGKVDRGTLISKVRSISPKGKTPITDSLTLAATSVGYYVGNSSVVMVTDGLETCEADPCAKARSLEFVNPGFSVHVVGFDVTEEEFKNLKCMAEETGGKFFRANNAKELNDALRQTVAATPAVEPAPAPTPPAEPEPAFFLYAKLCETCDRLPPLDVLWTVKKDGVEFYTGLGVLFPSDPVFEPGSYEVTARYLSSTVERTGEVVVDEDGQQIGEINLNGGGLSVYAYASDDKTLPANPMLYQFYPINDGMVSGKALDVAVDGGAVTWLPAGTYKIVAQHQSIEETAEIEIVANQVIEHTFDMRFGNLQPSAVLIDGGAPISHMVFRIYATKEAAIAGGYAGSGVAFGLTNADIALKAGDYWIWAVYSPYNASNVEGLFPVTVRTNEVSKPVLTMNAGFVDFEIASAGEDVGVYFGVRILKVNPDGSDGKQAGKSANRVGKAALAPGRYRFLRLSRKNRVVTDDFEIIAGQTTVFKATIR